MVLHFFASHLLVFSFFKMKTETRITLKQNAFEMTYQEGEFAWHSSQRVTLVLCVATRSLGVSGLD